MTHYIRETLLVRHFIYETIYSYEMADLPCVFIVLKKKLLMTFELESNHLLTHFNITMPLQHVYL